MPENYRIIFVLVSHPVLGYIVEAYRINVLKNGQWSVERKQIADFSSQFLNFQLTEIESQVLTIIQTTKEENVFEHFSLLKGKKKSSNNTFFEEKICIKHLMPYVSKHTAAIIDFLVEHEIPVYFKSEDRGLIGEEPLKIEPDYAEPRFRFDLHDNSFTYNLKIFHSNKELSLEGASIISQSPCYLRVENVLYSLPEEFEGQLMKPFLKCDKISIPREKINVYLQTFVSKIIRKHRAEVNGFSVSELQPTMQPRVSISKLHKKIPVIELSFLYDSELFFAHASQDFILKLLSSNDSVSFVKIFRDKEAEQQIMQKIASLGFQMVQPGYYTCGACNHEEALVTVSHLLGELSTRSSLFRQMGVLLDVCIDNKKYSFDEPKIFTSISGRNDWFDLQMNIKFGEFSVPFQKIIPNIIKSNPEFMLPDGTIALLPQEWFSRFKDLSVLTEQGEHGIVLHKSQVNLLESIEKSLSDTLSQKMKSLLNREIPPKDVPVMLKATMRDYQHRGFEWMAYLRECGLGACLADDMGLGKTIQTLAYFLHVSQNETVSDLFEAPSGNGQLDLFGNGGNSRVANTHLIVAPLSLLHNWQEEIAKFAPSLKTIMYTGPDRYRLYHYFHYADVVLTSYGIVRNDADVMKHFDFHTIVLDESQFIKNPESKSYDALVTLSSKQRFVLTGTPLENSLADIWTQMNFLNPGMLGSLKAFKDSYVIPVEKNKDEAVAARIQKLISSFILRRTKSEVTPELPDLMEKVCYCTMTDEQRSLYEKKKSEIRNFLVENSGPLHKSKRNMVVLSGLMKLRLIANHPVLTDESYDGKSGKYDEICQHIDKVVSEGHKTIVFSQFVKHLQIIRNYLDSKGIQYEVLTGQTSQKDRQTNIRSFKSNENIKLFLMTLKAGGVGLNLTQADYVFMLDPWWNPASENQAVNRTHRIGQDKKVFAYKFISRDSIEEKIMVLQQKKSELFHNIISSSSFSKLNEDDLLNLFE